MEALAGEGNSEKGISHDSNAREGKIGTVTESDIARPGPKDATEMRQKNIAPDIDAEGRAVEGAGWRARRSARWARWSAARR